MVFGAITVAVGYLQELNNDYIDGDSLKCRLFGIASFVLFITAFWAVDFVREMPVIPGRVDKETEQNLNADVGDEVRTVHEVNV